MRGDKTVVGRGTFLSLSSTRGRQEGWGGGTLGYRGSLFLSAASLSTGLRVDKINSRPFTIVYERRWENYEAVKS